jgi:hypothetical protein
VETASSSKTSLNNYQSTHHIPDNFSFSIDTCLYASLLEFIYLSMSGNLFTFELKKCREKFVCGDVIN